MILKYKETKSEMKSLPGGGPQGTLLGLFLFIVLINDAGFENQEKNIGEIISQKHDNQKLNNLHLKYIDDLTLAEAIPVKNVLNYAPTESRPQPDTYNERTGHYLRPEDSDVFKMIKQTENYADANNMKLNYEKTKLMVFNPGTKKDFLPRFSFNDKELEVVKESKLLGVIIRIKI